MDRACADTGYDGHDTDPSYPHPLEDGDRC